MPVVPLGSINLAALSVPNVYVQIVPPNPLLNGVPTNSIGNVGTASWGPVNSPRVSGGLSEYVSIFGPPQPLKYDLGTCVYVENGLGANNFICVRVTDGTDEAAIVALLDTQSPNAGVAAFLTSIYTGSLGNTTTAIISQGSGYTPSNQVYKLTVYMSGGIPEVFDNIGGSGVIFWNNLVSAVNQGQSAIRGPSQLVIASLGTGIGNITITNSGSGYTSAPSVLFSGGDGTGVAGTAILGFPVQSASIGANGSGYLSLPTIKIIGNGNGATGNAVLGYGVASASVTAGGSGYTSATAGFSGGGGGSGAAATVTVGSGAVTLVTITNPGSLYTSPPAIAISGDGTGATATATLTDSGELKSITITNPGSDYTLAPTISITGGSGSGATATSTLGSTGTLKSISITQSGTGYTSSPSVNFSGGGGSNAAATAIVGGSTSSPALSNYILSGGTDGNDSITTETLIGNDASNPRTGMYALRGTVSSAMVVLADADDSTYWTDQVAFGQSESCYVMGTVAAGYQDNISGAVTLKQNAGIDSYSFSLLTGDWVQINDTFNNITRFISPQSFKAGELAVLDPSNSSLNKIMTGIVATQKTAESRIYSDADLSQLKLNGLEVITKPIPASNSAFGCRLGINTSSNQLQNTDNYTRMINFLGQTIVKGMGPFVGLPQTPDIRLQAKNSLQTFFQNLVQLGIIGDVNGGPAYKVILDSSNNPSNRVALGYMQADVQIVLFSIIQYFIVNLNAQQGTSIQVLPPQLAA